MTNASAAAKPGSRARRHSRRDELLEKAAELIARNGFEGTSMRDIAASVDMLPGSLYYHFASKEDMLLEIHEKVVQSMIERVKAAISTAAAPWDQIEAAAVAHLEGLMESGNLVSIISPNFPEERGALNDRIKAQRREYEQIFRGLFDALPLPNHLDPRVLRLQLLGALNWVPVWFQPGRGRAPAEVARQFTRTLRDGCQAGTAGAGH